MYRASLVDGRVDPKRVRRILDGMSRDKPRGYLAILKNYHRLVAAELEKGRALVESAAPLDSAGRASVEKEIRRRHGGHLEITFAARPELIGGLRVRIGSDVWDGSVGNRLARLKTKL